MIKILIKKGN